jgi:hypothetical protein
MKAINFLCLATITFFIFVNTFPQTKDSAIFKVQWNNTQGNISCIVNEREKDGYILRTLNFYLDKIETQNVISTYETIDYPIALIPLSDESNVLLAIYQSGSAYHIYAFSYIGNKIEQVLETGSRCFPELVYNSKGCYNIIVTDHEWGINKETKGKDLLPKYATIYKWNGTRYLISKKVNWSQRLKKAFSF